MDNSKVIIKPTDKIHIPKQIWDIPLECIHCHHTQKESFPELNRKQAFCPKCKRKAYYGF